MDTLHSVLIYIQKLLSRASIRETDRKRERGGTSKVQLISKIIWPVLMTTNWIKEKPKLVNEPEATYRLSI